MEPFLLMTLPVLAPLFIAEAILWDAPFAALHACVNLLLSWVLVEAALLHFDKVPFTCSYLPGKANLPFSADISDNASSAPGRIFFNMTLLPYLDRARSAARRYKPIPNPA